MSDKPNNISQEDWDKFKGWHNNYPEEAKKRINKIMSDFLSDEKKKRIIKEFKKEDIETMYSIIGVVSYVLNEDIDREKKDCEFIKILYLLEESQKNDKISDELLKIYENNLTKFQKDLENKKEVIKKEILGSQYQNYLNLKSTNKTDICEKIFKNNLKNADSILKEKYDRVKSDLDNVTNRNFGPLLLKLSVRLLNTKVDDKYILENYAYLIKNPEHQFLSYLYLDDKWATFPLKWLSRELNINELKLLFSLYKKENDVSIYYESKYQNNNFDNLINMMENHYLYPPISHIMCCRKKMIEEIINCYKNNYYVASICTSLPIIEGILWDFSLHYHAFEGNIYSDIEKKHGINYLNQKIIENMTIGDLLKNTLLNQFFDNEFIDYFCNELYKERNPILHGSTEDYYSKINASKKIATIEYLLLTMAAYLKNRVFEGLSKTFSKDYIDEMLNNIESNIKNLIAEVKP